MFRPRRSTRRAATSAALFLLVAAFVRFSSSIDIPINTTVLNSAPRITGVRVLDQSVDPRSLFLIEVQAEDNNTLLDVAGIQLRLSAASGTQLPLVLLWTRSGFEVLEGDGEVQNTASSVPKDLKRSAGTWLFAAKLPGDARPGSWQIQAIVSDEEASSEMVTMFWVNSYVSIAIARRSDLNISILPGAVQGPTTVLALFYTSNQKVDLLARATPFVGAQDSSFKLESSAFSLSIEGGEPISLSAESRPILQGLKSGRNAEARLLLSVTIPHPFLDQDYEGVITLTLRPSSA